jgi:Domain of unknown function (DUF4157)
MLEHQQTKQSTESKSTNQNQVINKIHIPISNPAAIIQRARYNPKSLNHADVMQLQRTIGNRAVDRLLSEIRKPPSVAQQALTEIQEIPVKEDIFHSKLAKTMQRREKQGVDSVTDQVMKMSDTIIQRRCANCDEDERKILQTKKSGQRSITQGQSISPILHDVLHSPGESLDHATRSFMEPRFGYDFSKVRVHTNENAAESSRAVNALAYTVGRNIVFGRGQFSPQTVEGRRLLSHELTHVIQQGAISSTNDSSDLINTNNLQRFEDDGDSSVEQAESPVSDEILIPEPIDDENYVVGNTIDLVSGDSPAELLLTSSMNSTKAPKEKGKTKMGGPLGPVEEGLGLPKAELSSECKEWIKIKRTTYGYDPDEGADPVENGFSETYKDFKEGIPISKPEDFNEKLKAATLNPCTCIENLGIDGHGGSWSGGAQEFAPRKYLDLEDRSFGVMKNREGKIVPYNFGIFDGITFCKPCQIRLGGCYVALNTPKVEAGPDGFKGAGNALGKALAAKTGCSVTAYTDTTSTEKAGEFKGSGAGKWVTTEPEKPKK